MCTILIQVLDTAADLWLLFVLLFALNIFITLDDLKRQKFEEDLMIFNVKIWLYARGCYDVWK
ncbi:TPA: hypothetical protein R4328_002191 [Pasteurella multocida]|uniref:Uncharacterized protein n=1 Tax=Pasteurella multocida TaxID=747 RepID=A0AAW8VBG9_PASMD|nr:hypothetical protein [Pasteurella multocida]MDH7438357.1 hypothetical protein [Pasteurella multocida]MDH7441013.1 hypothetical protein [Pasteurella multocida]MDT3453604.1 hypothetical protein [Pasteurella multocida]MDY0438391.1 hypothetical protein [Pasteurella multocida]MDY0440619.1 hypothetical protein [Pasteurella multocida]